MRPVAVLLVLLALLPVAQARPDLDEGHYTVGPCRAGYTLHVDAETRYVVCVVEGQEVVYLYEGTTLLGHWCVLRVAGQAVYECPVDG